MSKKNLVKGPKTRRVPNSRDLKHQQTLYHNIKTGVLNSHRLKRINNKDNTSGQHNLEMLAALNTARFDSLDKKENSAQSRGPSGIKLNSKMGCAITFLFLCSLMQNAQGAVREKKIDMTGGEEFGIDIEDRSSGEHGLISLEGAKVGHLHIEKTTQFNDDLISHTQQILTATGLNNTQIQDFNLDNQEEFNAIISAKGMKEVVVEDKAIVEPPSSYAEVLSSLKKVSADNVVDAKLKIKLPSERAEHTIEIEADTLQKLTIEQSTHPTVDLKTPLKSADKKLMHGDTVVIDQGNQTTTHSQDTASENHTLPEKSSPSTFLPLKHFYEIERERCRRERQRDQDIIHGICAAQGKQTVDLHQDKVYYKQGKPWLGETRRDKQFDHREILDFSLPGGTSFIDDYGQYRNYYPSEDALKQIYQYQERAQTHILNNIGGDEGLARAVVEVAISPNGDPHQFRKQVGSIDGELAFAFPELHQNIVPLTQKAFKRKLKEWESASIDFNQSYQSGGWGSESPKLMGTDAGIPALRKSTLEAIKNYAEAKLDSKEISWSQKQILQALIQASTQSLNEIHQEYREDIDTPNSRFKQIFASHLATVAEHFPYQEKLIENEFSEFENNCVQVAGFDYKTCGIDKNRFFDVLRCLDKNNAEDCGVDDKNTWTLERGKAFFSL